MKEIKQNIVKVNTMYVVCHSHRNQDFLVTEDARPNRDMLGALYCVDLPGWICDCGRFQALWFSCAHVIFACGNLRIEYTPYINDVYKLECMHSVWSPEFPLVLDESMWLLVSSVPFELAPNRDMCCVSKGRPNSTRIRKNMDLQRGTVNRDYASTVETQDIRRQHVLCYGVH
ncbi:hypothetical protein PVK06_047662 [Gossypium arboreum]|uniref:SWIM-type domain-containing protein n=1 Tax=Gossypium arboreum TaxID=29729 RepID=A0ABR0MEA6_GOSAR|nr:hypothetical protein PVK06_047662 [Gossypium arboreum]